MTCIVGIVEKKKVYLGGDSAGVSGWNVTIRKDPKVFRVGEFVFGFTSSFRMGQLIRYQFKPPTHEKAVDAFEYLSTKWVDALRECFKKGGFASKEKDEEIGGCFLVAYRGRLFKVDSDYQIGESLSKYEATGIGESYALGALRALHKTKIKPKEKLRMALDAAEHFCMGVRSPFIFEEI